jgi:hypothetical protein
MGCVAPPLAELTAHAQTLTSAGDLVGARRVLAEVLDPAAAADPRHADADLALAAALHARILIALGDPHGARLWAGFAHAAEERLHGALDERTVAAAATHAAVLQRVGHHGRAAQVYHELVGDLIELDGPDSPRVLAAEADLATAEHAAGHCTAARTRLAEAWRRYGEHHGAAAPAGIKMLARLGAMERECGRAAESREHLAMAQELCTRHLPADHPLVRQTAALAVAPVSGRHTCGRVRQSAGPPPPSAPVHTPAPTQGPAPAQGPLHTPAPVQSPVHMPTPTHSPDHIPAQSPAHSPAPAQSPAHSPAPAQSPAHRLAPAQGPVHGPDPAPTQVHAPVPVPEVEDPVRAEVTSPAPGVTTLGTPGVRATPFPRRPTVHDPGTGFPPDDLAQPPPDNRPTDPNGTVYQQPLYLADVHQAPGDLTGRHARADTPPPLPGSRAPDYGPDGRPVPVGSAPTGTLVTPPNSERLLPVLTDRPAERRSRQPFILAAVLVAGVAAAAAVVILTLPDADGGVGPEAAGTAETSAGPASAGDDAPAAPAPTTGSSAKASAAAGAPTAVRLRDDRDSVTLQWTYPKGAEGPVLISGGRAGQPQRAFQQLPAGAADYIVYGLNTELNYCFKVAVAYSTDRIADSVPVCTRR